MVEALLEPMLRQLDLDFQSLGVPGGALAITSAFASSTPSPAGLRPGPVPVAAVREDHDDDLMSHARRPDYPVDRGEYSSPYAPPSTEEPSVDDPPPESDGVHTLLDDEISACTARPWPSETHDAGAGAVRHRGRRRHDCRRRSREEVRRFSDSARRLRSIDSCVGG